MKINKKLITAGVISLVVLSFGTVAFSYEADDIAVDKASSFYLITPTNNTEEWAELKTYQDKLEICQINEEDLTNLSTEELFDVCMAYPNLGDFIFSNSLQAGYEKVVKNFNGLQEFLNRDDVGTVLFNKYKNINPEKIKNTQRYPCIYMQFLEFMISQENVLNKMTAEEREELINLAVSVQESKSNYDIFSVNESFLIAGRSLMIDNPEFRDYVENDVYLSEYLSSATFINDKVDMSAAVEEIFQYINVD